MYWKIPFLITLKRNTTEVISMGKNYFKKLQKSIQEGLNK